MESRFEAKTYVVKYFCEPCSRKGGGEFIYSGRTMLTSPPQYQHVCNRCGETKLLLKQYPTTEMELLSK